MEDTEQKQCPFCEATMSPEGKLAMHGTYQGLLDITSVSNTNYFIVNGYRCPECGYMAFFGRKDEPRETPLEKAGRDIAICKHCGAKNFRRTECHQCGYQLSQQEDDRFDYSDKLQE